MSTVEVLVPRHAKRVHTEGAEDEQGNKKPKTDSRLEDERQSARQQLCAGLSVLGAPDARVELRKSTIENAGWGVFSTLPIKAGEAITEYCGELVTYDEAVDRPLSHLRTHARRRWAIDGTRLPDGTLITDPPKQLIGCGVGAFANHAVRAENQNAKFDFVDSEHNERAFQRFKAGGAYDFDSAHRVTLLRATCDIAPGEEIFVDYGRDYRGFADGDAPRFAQ